MGELFKREVASQSLEFTGERLTNFVQGQVEIEHLHRYFLARAYCRDKDVLDVASGEGYGSAYLAQVARSVVGVEIDPGAVAHAAESYKSANIRFLVGDAKSLPLENASVDVVVSFETLEHFFGQAAFIREVRRVLRPDGLFIISTPDRDNYSPHFVPPNIDHVKELNRVEFGRMLSGTFPWVVQMLQRPMIGSAIFAEETASTDCAPLVFERRGASRFEASEGMARPLYLIAFAGNAPVAVPTGSLYIESSLLDLHAQQLGEVQVALATVKAEAANAAERACIQVSNAEMARTVAERAANEARATIRNAEIARAAAERAATEACATISAIYSSTTWRLMGPVRRLGRRVPGLARLLRPIVKGIQHRLIGAVPAVEAPIKNNSVSTDSKKSNFDSRNKLTKLQEEALGIGNNYCVGKIAIGIVTYNTPVFDLRRLVSSARVSLSRAGSIVSNIYVIDNGIETDEKILAELGIQRCNSRGNIGFGAGHNVLMREAFEAGADVYIAANPDGAFHPDAITALLNMVYANRGNSLVEAIQFPEEHPKIYDQSNLDTPWVSGACLAIHRNIYDKIGGFDEEFFMYCEDVDYSWRAKVAGFSTKICPRALFFHAVTNRAPDEAVRRRYLEAGIKLASKWRASVFEAGLRNELSNMNGSNPPPHPKLVPPELVSFADFDHLFSFAETRW